MKTFLFLIFTAVYFLCFYWVIDFLFSRLAVNLVYDIASIVCLVAALAASIGLADFTVRKVSEKL